MIQCQESACASLILNAVYTLFDYEPYRVGVPASLLTWKARVEPTSEIKSGERSQHQSSSDVQMYLDSKYASFAVCNRK